MKTTYGKTILATAIALCVCGCGSGEDEESANSNERFSDRPLSFYQFSFRGTPEKGFVYKCSTPTCPKVIQILNKREYLASTAWVSGDADAVFHVKTCGRLDLHETIPSGYYRYLGEFSYKNPLGAEREAHSFEELKPNEAALYDDIYKMRSKGHDQAEKDREAYIGKTLGSLNLNTEKFIIVQKELEPYIKSMRVVLSDTSQSDCFEEMGAFQKAKDWRALLNLMWEACKSKTKFKISYDRIYPIDQEVLKYRCRQSLPSKDTVDTVVSAFANTEFEIVVLGKRESGADVDFSLGRRCQGVQKELSFLRFIPTNTGCEAILQQAKNKGVPLFPKGCMYVFADPGAKIKEKYGFGTDANVFEALNKKLRSKEMSVADVVEAMRKRVASLRSDIDAVSRSDLEDFMSSYDKDFTQYPMKVK